MAFRDRRRRIIRQVGALALTCCLSACAGAVENVTFATRYEHGREVANKKGISEADIADLRDGKLSRVRDRYESQSPESLTTDQVDVLCDLELKGNAIAKATECLDRLSSRLPEIVNSDTRKALRERIDGRRAMIFMSLGDLGTARDLARTLDSPGGRYLYALASARAGDAATARPIAESFAKQFDPRQVYFAVSLFAAMKDYDRAVRLAFEPSRRLIQDYGVTESESAFGGKISAAPFHLSIFDEFSVENFSYAPRVNLYVEFTVAACLLELGRTEDARQRLQRITETPEISAFPEILWMSHYYLGRLSEISKDSRAAIRHYEDAAAVIDVIRSTIRTEASRISFVSNKREVFSRLVGLYIDTGAGASAFATAQRGFSANVDAALAQASARRLADKFGLGDDAVAYERALATLEELNLNLARATGSPGVEEKQKQLTEQRRLVQARSLALEDTLKARAPAYWDYRAPQPVDVAALQATSGDHTNLLHANEALVLVLNGVGEQKGAVFAISKTGFAFAKIDLKGADLEDKVLRLRTPLNEGKGYFNRKGAHEIYRALFGDPQIQGVINGRGIDTLLIAANGPMTSLPPSLLVVEPPAGLDSDPAAVSRTHWLIRDKAIAVLPAASSLKTLRVLLPALHRTADLKLLAFADPDFQGTGVTPEQRVTPGSTGSGPVTSNADQNASNFEGNGRGKRALTELKPLYYTLIEGKELASTLAPDDPDALLVGPDATKTRLLFRDEDHSLARVEVLSFATHGLLTGDMIGLNEPALALAHPPKVGAHPDDRDGLLKASEVASLTLNADWVVLSACNTASGDGTGAEGLSGLARAFFHAGASALLVSHWMVNDKATSTLVPDAIRLYKSGLSGAVLTSKAPTPGTAGHQFSKAQALRLAMLKMIDEPSFALSKPYFWAPFVVAGEPD